MEQEIQKRIKTLRLTLWNAKDVQFYFAEGRDSSYRLIKELSGGATTAQRDAILKHYGTDFDRELQDNYKELDLLRSSAEKPITNEDEWVESLCKITLVAQCLQASNDEREKAILKAYKEKLVLAQRKYYGIAD